MEWLDFVGIARLAKLPAGSLSYGQRKLLELAYVLVADPDVILLDEPAGGVNLTLINVISEKIRSLNKDGKTFLIVEHNMEFVMNLCDSVTVMHQGSDLVTGTPAEVRSDPRSSWTPTSAAGTTRKRSRRSPMAESVLRALRRRRRRLRRG